MKKKQESGRKQHWHRKPSFGSLYVMKGSKYIYISINYFKQRLRFPTDRVDSAKNWDELCDFLHQVGEKIKNRTFCFAKSFYWMDEDTKAHFTLLEGGDYKPPPEHVQFGEYAEKWIAQNIPTFDSISTRVYYEGALRSRIIPHFAKMNFASITAHVIESFIDNLKRTNGSPKPLSVRRIKNIVGPLSTVWNAACNEYSWNIKNPFSGTTKKYNNIKNKANKVKQRNIALKREAAEADSKRAVFLLSEWKKLLNEIDPHYHVVLELLLRGVIGSELEGLQKADIVNGTIKLCSKIVRESGGKLHMEYKLKNWYRTRDIPMTRSLSALINKAAAKSQSNKTIQFEDGIALPANAFLLTMANGDPFNYESFRNSVWYKAVDKIGLAGRVPYALRHSFTAWSLLIGVSKSRMVDLMGHSSRQMVDERYGKYRQGLVEEREQILDYLGEDFLALEELRVYFPERYKKRIALASITPEKSEAPALPITFCQSFGQSQGLYADNYA